MTKQQIITLALIVIIGALILDIIATMGAIVYERKHPCSVTLEGNARVLDVPMTMPVDMPEDQPDSL